jgi:myo-inositol-1(or 4)-monophosphatase
LPALDELLYAETNSGTFWNGRLARVSQKSEMKSAVICTGSHRLMDQRGHTENFLTIARKTMATRTWSDAYGHALVATGRVEAMVDPSVSRWDISAMKIIVEEAGGVMTDFGGGAPLCEQAHGSLEAISSNGKIHSELVEALRG